MRDPERERGHTPDDTGPDADAPSPVAPARRGRPARPPGRLPTRSRGGEIVGGILAGLEATVTNRPVPPARIEEAYRDAWASLDGVTVEGLDERPERPDPPDRSGAKI